MFSWIITNSIINLISIYAPIQLPSFIDEDDSEEFDENFDELVEGDLKPFQDPDYAEG